MNFTGTKVKHAKFGEGKIVKVDDKIVTVCFSIGVKEFKYPESLVTFLEVLDESVKAEISRIVEDYNSREQQEKEVEEIKREERIRAIVSKIKSKSIYTADFSKIERGYVYGTNSRIIYEKFCDTLGWDKNKADQFGWQTRLYATNCDTGRTSDVWFIFYANYDAQKLDNVVNDVHVVNFIQNDGDKIIEIVDDSIGESNNANRITFVKTDKGYEFLGVYEIEQNGTSRIYKRISTIYPIKT